MLPSRCPLYPAATPAVAHPVDALAVAPLRSQAPELFTAVYAGIETVPKSGLRSTRNTRGPPAPSLL